MGKKDNSNLIATIVLGAFIAVVLGAVIYFGNLIGPEVKLVANRQETTTAVVTEATPYGVGMVFKYNFRYEGKQYQKDASCTRGCESLYITAKEEGKITVWFDPKDPTNSFIEKPNMGMYYFLQLLYWGLIFTFSGIYLVFLYNTWIKSEKRPTMKEMGVPEGTLPEGRHGPGCKCGHCPWSQTEIP